jgi:hypothetical protein
MRRPLLKALAAISLLMFATTITMWIVTPRSGQSWHFTFDLGRSTRSGAQNNFDLVLARSAGFSWRYNRWNLWSNRQLTIPFWFLIGLTAVPAIVCEIWIRRQRRRSVGFCEKCGYDLRATPERCPECGLAIIEQMVPTVPQR